MIAIGLDGMIIFMKLSSVAIQSLAGVRSHQYRPLAASVLPVPLGLGQGLSAQSHSGLSPCIGQCAICFYPPLTLPSAQGHWELGQGDGPSHGGDDLETHNIQCDPCNPHSDKGIEPGLLGIMSLLLHWCNLQNLILEGDPREKVNSFFQMGTEGRDLSFMFLSMWASLMIEIHSLSLALPPTFPAWPEIDRPWPRRPL